MSFDTVNTGEDSPDGTDVSFSVEPDLTATFKSGMSPESRRENKSDRPTGLPVDQEPANALTEKARQQYILAMRNVYGDPTPDERLSFQSEVQENQNDVVVSFLADAVAHELKVQIGDGAGNIQREFVEEVCGITRELDSSVVDPLIRSKVADIATLIRKLTTDAVCRLRSTAAIL